MATIIVADNQDITSLGIMYICGSLQPLPDIKQVSGRGELVRELTCCPEAVTILDYSLFDFDGISDLQMLTRQFRQVHWLFLEHEPTDDRMLQTWYCNEQVSILWKGCSTRELTEALKGIFAGRRFICPHMRRSMHVGTEGGKRKIHPLLTDTEQQILYAVVQGQSTRQIAEQRASSIHTIYTHKKNIFRKLQVRNVREAVRYAMQHALVDTIEYYI